MKYLILIILFIPYSLISNKLVLKFNPAGEIAVSIDCPDKINCYIITQIEDIHKLYKSHDFGNTWNLIYKSKPLFEQPPPPLINAYDACSPHPDYIFMAMFDARYIKKSSDGGKTFENINLGTGGKNLQPIRKIAMKDTSTGIVVGDSLFIAMTFDGWKTFKKIDFYQDIPRNEDKGPLSIISPLFHGNDTLFFFGGIYNFKDSTQLDTDKSSLGLGIFTWDYKKNECSYVLIPETKWDTTNGNRNPIYESFNDICFVNDTLGFICGKKRRGIGDSGHDIIYKTTNKGIIWEKIYENYRQIAASGLLEISFKDAQKGIAVGPQGNVIITGDGGNTWDYLEIPFYLKDQQVPTMVVTWAGDYPIIGTYGAGFWRVEGPDGGPPVFKTAVLPSILTQDHNFGTQYVNFPDTLTQKLKIYNLSDTVDLRITGYSALTDSAFSTSLPKVDFINPIIIKLQEYYEYTVFFKPYEVRKYSDSIVFYSNSKVSDNVAVFSGEGIDDTSTVDDSRTIINQINISPNPASKYIEINLGADSRRQTADGKQELDIQIFNVYGIRMTVMVQNLEPLRIDISGFPDGIYFLKLSESSKLSESYRIYKFVVIK